VFAQAYRHLLAQLTEMPPFLERALLGLPRDLLLRQPANDRSPLLEHLWHLRDCEVDLYAARIEQVLREDMPSLAPVDVGAWVSDRHYPTRDGDSAVLEFGQLRGQMLARLHSLDEAQLSRTARRFDGSAIDVLGLIEQVAEHDRDHRGRIVAILRNYMHTA